MLLGLLASASALSLGARAAPAAAARGCPTMMAAAAPAMVDVSNHAHEIAFIPNSVALLEKKPVK